MTVCVPTTSAQGAVAHVSTQFDEAPYYTLVDLEATRAQAFPNLWKQDEERWAAAKGLEGKAVDAVICRGISPMALGQLRAHGVAVLTTDARTVVEAVRAFRAGKVSRPTFAAAPLRMVANTP